MWCGIVLVLLGNIVRMIPVVARQLTGDEQVARSPSAFICYHIGQIFVAMAGPFNMGAVTLLSVVWFAESERTTATAIAQVSNGMGATVAYLNPLWLMTSPVDMPNLFYFGLALAVLPLLGALVYLPARPPRFPSAAAEAAAACAGGPREVGRCAQLSRRPSFVVLVGTVGIFSGAMAAFTSLFQTMLGPEGVDERAVGWMGFGNGLACNVAGILAGSMIDRCFRRRLKGGILVGLLGVFLCLAWFMLSLPCFGVKAPNSVLPHADWSLALTLTLAGVFQGIAEPLFYELAAELMYPAKESTSAGVIVFVMNAAAGVTIGLNSVCNAENMNYVVNAIVLVVFLAVLLGVREEYRRPQDGGGRGDAATKPLAQAGASRHASEEVAMEGGVT